MFSHTSTTHSMALSLTGLLLLGLTLGPQVAQADDDLTGTWYWTLSIPGVPFDLNQIVNFNEGGTLSFSNTAGQGAPEFNSTRGGPSFGSVVDEDDEQYVAKTFTFGHTSDGSPFQTDTTIWTFELDENERSMSGTFESFFFPCVFGNCPAPDPNPSGSPGITGTFTGVKLLDAED